MVSGDDKSPVPQAVRPLPHEPEPMAAMQARWEAAVEGDWNAESDAALAEYPGLRRRHIFDFEDGVRLIAAFETGVFIGPVPALHVSASIRPGGNMEKFLAGLPDVPARRAFFIVAVVRRLWTIAGRNIPLAVLFFDGGIPHLAGPTRTGYAAIRPWACVKKGR